jgi:hypothetical protein
MHKFVIPALDLLYGRLKRGFTQRQKIFAVLAGVLILFNFMYRAGCPPESRFATSGKSGTVAVCAPPDVVRFALPMGEWRNAEVFRRSNISNN